MNPRHTAILALLVAAVGAFVWFYEIRGGEQRRERTEAEKRVFRDVAADDIVLITLRTRDAQEARLERVEGAWKLLAPLSFPADGTAADGIAGSLARLSSEATVDDPAGPAEYGLDAPPKIRFRAGDRDFVLRVGDKTPIGASSYVAGAEDTPVYVVPTFEVASLDKTLDELRDRRPLRFDREAAVELRVRWRNGSARLVRDEQDPEAWRLVEPLAAAADARTVSRALSDLEFLRAVGFEDAPTAARRKELEQPELTVEIVTRADAEQATARLALGPADPGGKRVAEGAVAGTLYQIAAGALEEFPRSVDAFREKSLARYVADEARRFELAFHEPDAGATFLVTGTRDGQTWRTEPEAMKPEAAALLVRELSGLEAKAIAAESLGPKQHAELGLDPPRVVIRVLGGREDRAEGTLAEVQLGVADPKRGIAAKRADRETIFWLPFERSESLPTSAAAFRERFLAPAEPAAVPEEAAHPGAAPVPATP